VERPRADLTNEFLLGITILSSGGRTTVPKQVMQVLKLRYTPQKREKLLWLQEGDEIVVTKGTLQSSFRKTILSRDGTAAVPKHIREVLKLKSTLHKEERVMWIQKGDEIVVRKETPHSNPALGV
jgi:bifunctional DNA-binding transcriptional regulator/antitoxin component of YhaV-PrlF toxin-antitoxin module